MSALGVVRWSVDWVAMAVIEIRLQQQSVAHPSPSPSSLAPVQQAFQRPFAIQIPQLVVLALDLKAPATSADSNGSHPYIALNLIDTLS